MTPKEASVAIAALKKKIGPGSIVSISISGNEKPDDQKVFFAWAKDYDRNYSNNLEILSAHYETLEEAVLGLQEATEKYMKTGRDERLKLMALAIIRITYEKGQCTELDLRIEPGINAAMVRELGAEACKLADTMGDNHPFSIIPSPSGNAPDLNSNTQEVPF